MVPGKALAFVEFGDEIESSVAMNKLQGCQLGDYAINITYQKRI